jgi:hypothetical protein
MPIAIIYHGERFSPLKKKAFELLRRPVMQAIPNNKAKYPIIVMITIMSQGKGRNLFHKKGDGLGLLI